jgi:hypothetical protein
LLLIAVLGPTMKPFLVLLAASALCASGASVSIAEEKDDRPAKALQDNSFLIEEAYNQEELQALVDVEFDVTLTGFSLAEVDLSLDQAHEASPTALDNPADRIPVPQA